MSHKALTAAIAAALAAPMAAQAVDFTISGQVNRALVHHRYRRRHQCRGPGTTAGAAAGVRAGGSSELADGSTVTIQFEYEVTGGGSRRRQRIPVKTSPRQRSSMARPISAGVHHRPGLRGRRRHRSTPTPPAWSGIGGTATGRSTPTPLRRWSGSQHGSTPMGDTSALSTRARASNMIRYDTPALGPISAAVSVGNGDSVSGLAEAEHRSGRLRVRSEARTHSGGRRRVQHRSLLRFHPGERPHHLRCLGKGQGP